MKRATVANLMLMITIVVWGTVLGGIAYSHIVFFPQYLSALPDSATVVTGPYGLNDGAFWVRVHPVLLVVLATTVAVNWRRERVRKLILLTVGVYLVALIATAVYFIPGLIAFADSANRDIAPGDWLERATWWQRWSWLRGGAMYLGIVPLLVALSGVAAPDRGASE